MLRSLAFLAVLTAAAASQPPVPPPPGQPPAPPPFPFANAPKAPPPFMMFVKANDKGQITFAEPVTTPKKVKQTVPEKGPDGKVVTREVEVVVPEFSWNVKPLDPAKLKVTTPTGAAVEYAAAVARVKDGLLVLASDDGKPVDAAFLKLYRDDVLVFASPELLPPPPPEQPPGGGPSPLPPPPPPPPPKK